MRGWALFLSAIFLFISPAYGGESKKEVPAEKQETYKVRKGFPSAPFVSVEAYAFNQELKGRPDCRRLIQKDGSVCHTAVEKVATLSRRQIKKVRKMATSRSTYSRYGSKCFIPRHAFVFRDAEGEVVGEMTICFECEMMHLFPDAAPDDKQGLSRKGMKAFRKLLTDLGLP